MQNLKNDKLYKLVYQEIRNYIIVNKLTEGDKLPPEMELCEMLGVSRNVLRESLKSLEIMGIVKPAPGIGYVIQSFSFDSIYENIFFYLLPSTDDLLIEMDQIRGALELRFFDEVFENLTDEDIEELGQAYNSLESKVNAEERASNEDFVFHNIIFRKVKNSMFHSIEKVTWDIHSRIVYSNNVNYNSHMKIAIVNHKNIYESIKAHNYESAKKYLKEHFTNTLNHARNYNKSENDINNF